MTTKTFKIGEYAKGGVITVEIGKHTVTIIGKEWDFSAGSKKSSNQSNAKEFCREEHTFFMRRRMEEFLNYLTTSYYAGQIMEWINSKIESVTKKALAHEQY